MKTISFYGGIWGDPFSKSTNSQDYKYREYINAPGIYDYMENSKETHPYYNAWLGIEYEHNFNDDGHKIVTEISGSYWQRKSTTHLQRSYINYPERDKNKKTSDYFKGANASIDIDYSLPYLKNGLIEIGFNCDYWPEATNKKIDTLSHLFPETYLLDSMRYEDFKSNEADFDAYFTIEHKFGNFKIKGGLRSENRLIQYKVINQPEHHDNKIYPGLYPSLHLSYSTKSMHNFSLSYTRRVNYPWASHINTFIVYDEDSYSTGNKNLKSTYTNSVEAGWTKYFTKFGSVDLKTYFRNNKNERNGF
jgi:hypothetical protein